MENFYVDIGIKGLTFNSTESIILLVRQQQVNLPVKVTVLCYYYSCTNHSIMYSV